MATAQVPQVFGSNCNCDGPFMFGYPIDQPRLKRTFEVILFFEVINNLKGVFKTTYKVHIAICSLYVVLKTTYKLHTKYIQTTYKVHINFTFFSMNFF